MNRPVRQHSVWSRAVPWVLLVGAIAVAFHPLLAHPWDLLVGTQRDGLNDVTDQFLAFRAFPKQSLDRFHEFPTWNPYLLCGMPWVGEPQTALFYPPNWLGYACTSPALLSWLLVGHHLIAGWGACCYGRRLGLSLTAAWGAGVAFSLGPFLLAQTGEGHYNQVAVMAWAPWVCWAFEGMRRRDWYGPPTTALFLALMFLAGHVQECFYLILLLTGVVVCDCVVAWRSTRQAVPGPADAAGGERAHAGVSAAWWWPFALWCVTGGFVGGLVAIELLPALTFTKQAVRSGGLTLAEASAVSLTPSHLLQLFNPHGLGSARDYTGPGYYWETLAHFGVLPVLLSGLALWRGRPRGVVARHAWLVVVCFVFAFGANTPVYGVLFRFVPGVALFRGPSRALFHATLFLAVLTGLGLDVLVRWGAEGLARSPAARRNQLQFAALCAVLAVATAIVGGVPWTASGGSHAPGNVERSTSRELRDANVGERSTSRESHEPSEVERATSPGPSLAPLAVVRDAPRAVRTQYQRTWYGRGLSWWMLALVCGGLAVVAASPRCGLHVANGLVLALVCELSLFANDILAYVPPSQLRLESPLTDFLSQHAGESRVLVHHGLLTDAEAWRHGICKVQGYEPVALRGFAEVMQAMSLRLDPANASMGFHPVQLRDFRQNWLDLLSVRFAVVPGHDGPEEWHGWRRVQRGECVASVALRGARPSRLRYSIYENPAPLPRAFVLGTTTVRPAKQPLRAALESLDPRELVLVENDALPSAGARSPMRPATVRARTASRVVVETPDHEAGYLVLGDIHYPGWRVRIDGRDAGEPEVVNGALQGLPLPAGRQSVELTFTPPRWRMGQAATLGTLVLLAVWCAGPWVLPLTRSHSRKA